MKIQEQIDILSELIKDAARFGVHPFMVKPAKRLLKHLESKQETCPRGSAL